MQKFFTIILLLLLASGASAQTELEHLSPFANGAGRTYALTSRGLDAVGLNPSLLGLGTPRPIEITVAPISSLGINEGSSLGQINSVSKGFDSIASEYIADSASGLTTGDSIREAIAKLLGNNALSSTIDARVLGVSYFDPDLGGFAFTWTMHAVLDASVPQGLLNYIGVGAVSNLATGDALTPQNLDIQAMWYSEYTLTYARTLLGERSSGEMQLLGGIGLKYITGIADLDMNPGEFDINDFDNYPDSKKFTPQNHYLVGVDYQIRSAYPAEFNFTNLPSTISAKLIENATAGSGVGADIGFTLGAFDSLQHAPFQFALSVSDIGSIHWNSNVSVRTADTVLNPKTTQGNKDTINGQLKALGGNLDTIGSYSTPLPTTLHVAAGIDLAEIGISVPGINLGVVAEYALGLTNTAGAPVNGRYGMGIILDRPGTAFAFHAALGYSVQDGSNDLTVAVGVGIGNRVMLDVGTDSFNGLFSSTGHTDLVFGLKLLF
ncbi:MAG TPA: DUF5723 family protein [Candidatus Kapabacteria bacterium]